MTQEELLKLDVEAFLSTHPTEDEVDKYIKQIDVEIQKLTNLEQGIKVGILNSTYGAFGNAGFRFYDKHIAESITKQSKDVILYTERVVNDYGKNIWHKDTELHKKMGIRVKKKLSRELSRYIDTDSIFMAFDEAFESQVGWDGTIEEFIYAIYEHRFKDMYKVCLERYAKAYNAENTYIFDLEYIANKGIFIKKKNYVMDITFDGRKYYEPNTKPLYYKGYETIRSSTPNFCREKLDEVVSFIFKYEVDTLPMDDMISIIKEIKKQFKHAKIDDIASNVRCNNYSGKVINDTTKLEYEKGTVYQVKAAALHNYLLNNSEYKSKYELIKDGDRVKVYHTHSEVNDRFAYLGGHFPSEIAPKINYDEQFYGTFIKPLNRIMEAMGLKKLTTSLVYASALF